ncbi:MAG: hypothetical protein C4292_07225 [Nitrososphaera sp.]
MTADQSHLPTASIGDRQLALDFTTTPAAPLPGDQIDMNLSLIDKNTGKNTAHVSYTVAIAREDGKRVFSEVVHGHEGKVSIRFINDASAQTYRVSANYDNLAASYVSDFGSPIKVQGPVFSTAGNYKVAIEVTGIDFDNTFLPEPLKYDFVLPLTPKQALTVNYQDTAFDMGGIFLFHRYQQGRAENREQAADPLFFRKRKRNHSSSGAFRRFHNKARDTKANDVRPVFCSAW